MEKIKVMIVDDFTQIVDCFKMAISRESDMVVVATANSGKEAVKKAADTNPDVILMDISMEYELAGVDAIKTIKESGLKSKIIVITVNENDMVTFNAYVAGAVDYISKNASIVEIITAIHNAYNNKLSIKYDVAEQIIDKINQLTNERNSLLWVVNIIAKLTTSEHEVLKLLCEGFSYKQIAQMRYVEYVTIHSQANSILKKFELKKMKEVVKLVKTLNLF